MLVAFMALASLAKAELVLTEARLNPVEGAAEGASTVVLPYLWDRSQPGQSAVAEFVFKAGGFSIEEDLAHGVFRRVVWSDS